MGEKKSPSSKEKNQRRLMEIEFHEDQIELVFADGERVSLPRNRVVRFIAIYLVAAIIVQRTHKLIAELIDPILALIYKVIKLVTSISESILSFSNKLKSKISQIKPSKVSPPFTGEETEKVLADIERILTIIRMTLVILLIAMVILDILGIVNLSIPKWVFAF